MSLDHLDNKALGEAYHKAVEELIDSRGDIVAPVFFHYSLAQLEGVEEEPRTYSTYSK